MCLEAPSEFVYVFVFVCVCVCVSEVYVYYALVIDSGAYSSFLYLGTWILNPDSWIQDAGCRTQYCGPRILDLRCEVRDPDPGSGSLRPSS